MIIDTSALMAILRFEPEAERFTELIASAERKLISSGSWIELAAVLSKPEEARARAELYRLRERLQIEIAPVSLDQARIGHEAYLEFGRNSHSARLNFGDCFSYALAKETGLPLLFKGNDFAQTDILSAR